MEEDTLTFKVFAIEEYRRVHGAEAPYVVELFEKYDVFGFLEEPVLQWQDLYTTVMHIDEYIGHRDGSL